MAYDAKPSTWIPSWSEDGTDITVPIASFPEMTAAEADATTGDIRKVVFAIVEELFAAWTDTASADRPTKMVITKSASIDVATNVITSAYTFVFKTDLETQEVAAES